MKTDMELIDVVNDDDEVIGRATKDECHRKRYLHRSVFVFLFDIGGRLILQRRSSKKDVRPGKVTASACGHVLSGETYLAAAARELSEELSISASLRRVLKTKGPYDYDREIITLFEGQSNEVPKPNEVEIDDLIRFELPDLLEAIEEGRLDFGATFKGLLREYISTKHRGFFR